MTSTVEHRVEPPAEGAGPATRVLDCDVHPVVPDGLDSLKRYMSQAWVRRFELKRTQLGDSASRLTPRYAHPGARIIREDAASPSGEVGGSDPQFVREDLLDRHHVDVAILNCLQPGALAAALGGPDESIALCSAFNDYFIERWLPVDERFRYAISVPSQDPAAAAQEVRRLGDVSQVAAVALPLLNVLVGNRYYYPIYEAADAYGLPILLHVTGTDLIYQGAPAGCGWPESYAERYVDLSQIGATNLSSLVFSGVFERFPRLCFAFVEYGFAWALPMLWRMDKAWQALRMETPWVKRFPSEYVRERVRFTTQPIDEPSDGKQLAQFIDLLGPELLAFSTDYPHWDNDMPGSVLQGLPRETRQQIYWQNGADVFRV